MTVAVLCLSSDSSSSSDEGEKVPVKAPLERQASKGKGVKEKAAEKGKGGVKGKKDSKEGVSLKELRAIADGGGMNIILGKNQMTLSSGDGMALLGTLTPYGSFPVTDDGYMAGPSEFNAMGGQAPTTVGATPFSELKDAADLHYFEVPYAAVLTFSASGGVCTLD